MLCASVFEFAACVGTNKPKYKTYQEAARAYDFEAAHQMLDELHEEYVESGTLSWANKDKKKKYDDAFDYVFNAEAMYLCAKGDKESLDRIIFLLSNIPVEGAAIPEGTQYKETDELFSQRDDHELYINYATRHNQKCNTLIDLAIANHLYPLAERVLPLLKDVPEPIKGREDDFDEETRLYKENHGKRTFSGIYKTQVITYSRIDRERAKEKVQNAIEEGVFPNH